MREETEKLQESGISYWPGIDAEVGGGGADIGIGIEDHAGVGIKELKNNPCPDTYQQSAKYIDPVIAGHRLFPKSIPCQ